MNNENYNTERNAYEDNGIQGAMLMELIGELRKDNIRGFAPKFKEGMVNKTHIEKIVKAICDKFNISPKYALAAICMLFLKGAATRTTPSSLAVEVNKVTITKQDLEITTSFVVGNKFLRRVAEAMAAEIGMFAEMNELDGELANRVDKLIMDSNFHTGGNEKLLTKKERAWCSSFSQGLDNLSILGSERLVKWLNVDFNTRFNKSQTTKYR